MTLLRVPIRIETATTDAPFNRAKGIAGDFPNGRLRPAAAGMQTDVRGRPFTPIAVRSRIVHFALGVDLGVDS
jgi:hypothetical protein